MARIGASIGLALGNLSTRNVNLKGFRKGERNRPRPPTDQSVEHGSNGKGRQ